jgi:hypothetical protein
VAEHRGRRQDHRCEDEAHQQSIGTTPLTRAEASRVFPPPRINNCYSYPWR